MKPNIFLALRNTIGKRKNTSESSRHANKSWKNNREIFSFSRIMLYLTILFLFLPLFVIILFSFNNSKGAEFTGFSFIWYKKLFFDSDALWNAVFNSVVVALTSGIVSTILGTAASIGVNWYKFKGKGFIQTISFLPMVLPEVIVGISMLIFFSGIKVPLGLFTIFAAHTTFCLPFVYLMVNARLDNFDFSVVEAAHDLGASELQTMTKVVIPAIMPGILSGFMMAITMSLEDFVITFFVSGTGSTTLPLYVYSMIRTGVTPVVNALSFVIILLTCGVAVILRKGLKHIAI